jgi:DNA-binding beta-propeller fold protein YncE
MRTRDARSLLLALVVVVGACGPRDRSRVKTAAAEGDVARDSAVAVSTAEPLVLGPPVQVIDSLPHASSVAVGPDGRYYVSVKEGGAPALIAVEPETMARSTYPDQAPRPTRAGVGVAHDKAGRVYLADSVDSAVLVYDPADSGTSKPRPVLTGLERPADLAVDAERDRLLVLETDANRLAVYDLP